MDNQGYTFGPKILTRYGKLVFSEDAIQCLGLTEDTYVKLGIDETFNVYLNISSKDDVDVFKLKKSGIYYYIACKEFLEVLVLYSPDPTIYELVKVDKTSGESFYRLDKIITIKSPKIGEIFQNRNELRSIVAMLNAKI